MSRDPGKKKKSSGNTLGIAIFCSILTVTVIAGLVVAGIAMRKNGTLPDLFSELVRQLETEETESESGKPETQAESETETETEAAAEPAFPDLQEEDIYTFMQGPKAWSTKVDWGGSWCDVELYDQNFSVFGCGLCCLANIYSTLTDCDCSPLDMFYYAREASAYKPVSYFGSIDWPEMKQTLATVGITAKLRKKDKTYEKFQETLKSGITATVLVASRYDSTYWKDVEGHYVNIWLYDESDDTVFLADSGNPDHNRQRVPLRYLYDAMKLSGTYQYMLVTGVDKDGNTWGHDGVEIRWNVPDYYKGTIYEFPEEETAGEPEELS